jgi:hypothetical protein
MKSQPNNTAELSTETATGATPDASSSVNVWYLSDCAQCVIYALALTASISIWFLAIRAPLWLDETGSFQQISAGFSQIPSRVRGLSFPAHAYILWFCTKITGTSEIALRVPEIFAMFGATYLLYQAARELFDRDVAIIASIVFCIHPIVVFASIDVRPYAFGALAVNAAILCLVRLRRNNSISLAALFGFSAASILYFHFLFATILPALAIGYFVIKPGESKILWRQFGVALTVFAIACLPIIPWVRVTLENTGSHVFDNAPGLAELGWTLAPPPWPLILLGAIFAAALTRRLDMLHQFDGRRALLCALLGLVPILTLYGASVGTPLHVFVERYRLVAIPGIGLCWALVVNLVNSRSIRLLFCVVLVTTVAYQNFTSPYSNVHGYTWKYALEFAEKNASVDGAPVVICSDFVESNYMQMPTGSAVKDSAQFAPLSYYKLSVPVVGLPRALNDEAIRVGSSFLQDAAARRQRFLVLGFSPSYETLRWLSYNASGMYEVRQLGMTYSIVILEFKPRFKGDGVHYAGDEDRKSPPVR